ncbi:CheW domain-containing protein [Stutzerimonas azotifigens]|uniref:CheW domain-containing protein n=1 Tax=Stutzerimonas azotifigens TaxID=291995 RepID=UPI0003FA15E4|nr:CheW domain-containing protein [Stutzerimonas azotifigens]
MSRTVPTATRPQLALQSYLDALLQEASIELAESVDADEFQAAVLEEQRRDQALASVSRAARPEPVAPVAEVRPPKPVAPVAVPEVVVPVAPLVIPAPVEPPAPVAEPLRPSVERLEPAPVSIDRQPSWADEPFECLLFDVAGLTLAVPLVSLGSIYPLAGQELTPLFGQPDWFLGILPCQAGNLKVLDTARWVMPDRYRDDFRQGLQYVISVQGYEWGLAVHQVSRSIRLDPREIKWRSQRGQRPWLAGTVIEHMCALLDVAALAELIASGAVRHPGTRA